MKVYEVINSLLLRKKISKKDFAQRLIALDPILERTGEPPSEKTVYKYLSGEITIPIDLVSFIASALDVSEQELFDDSLKTKINYAKHIVNSSNLKEINIIRRSILFSLEEKKIDEHLTNSEMRPIIKIFNLLPYAPNIFLHTTIKRLESIKAHCDEL